MAIADQQTLDRKPNTELPSCRLLHQLFTNALFVSLKGTAGYSKAAVSVSPGSRRPHILALLIIVGPHQSFEAQLYRVPQTRSAQQAVQLATDPLTRDF